MLARLPRLAVAAVAVAGFLTYAPRASADYVLDDFNNPNPGTNYQIKAFNGNPYVSPSTTVSSTVSRVVTVNVTAPNDPAFNAASGTIGGGAFSLATTDLTKATATISYGLSGSGRNLTGATGLSLGFVALDPGLQPDGTAATTSPITITLTDGSNQMRTRTLDATVPGNGNPFTQSFDFSSFTGNNNFNFGNVKNISIILNGGSGSQKGIDFTLDNVKVKSPNPVPAPPAVLLAGVGVLALIGRARLARKPAAA